MRPKHRFSFSFWKQDIAAVIAVAIYIAAAFLTVEAWNALSNTANAFGTQAPAVDEPSDTAE